MSTIKINFSPKSNHPVRSNPKTAEGKTSRLDRNCTSKNVHGESFKPSEESRECQPSGVRHGIGALDIGSNRGKNWPGCLLDVGPKKGKNWPGCLFEADPNKGKNWPGCLGIHGPMTKLVGAIEPERGEHLDGLRKAFGDLWNPSPPSQGVEVAHRFATTPDRTAPYYSDQQMEINTGLARGFTGINF